jgi:hypothetical protein
MTMHTAGWIEVRIPDWDGPRPVDQRARDPVWEAVFYVEPFITWDYEEVVQRTGSERVSAIMQTGRPVDVSARVREDHEADNAAWAGVTSPQWSLWKRFKTIQWSTTTASAWDMVMQIGELMAHRYGDENVRITLWDKVVMG